MTDSGDTKDDVKVPDGEVGDKIMKLFREDEKDTSTLLPLITHTHFSLTTPQTSSSSPPWAKKRPSTPRRLPPRVKPVLALNE